MQRLKALALPENEVLYFLQKNNACIDIVTALKPHRMSLNIYLVIHFQTQKTIGYYSGHLLQANKLP